ncbi:PA14 domain-containing protein [Bacillus kwashiorkori]|uniref:PA14 domain-containing protein n=1 Tax=Bacillus kwashiorkori TaxID=1522318 RepID=UPI0007859CEF|nr:PA14 domain-containing protein [Bacillus kwashiorkori]
MPKYVKFIWVFVSILFVSLALTNQTEASSSKWEATYYPSVNFTGTSVKQTYDDVNFKWYDGSPVQGIPNDYFSAIFKREFSLEEGIYDLKVWANDGVQVFVDGNLEIDGWNNKSINYMEKPVYVTSGKHEIMIKYKEITGWAELRFQMEELVSDSRWYGMAFSKSNFTGSTALLGAKSPVNNITHDWGWGSPAKNIPGDHFSVFYKRKLNVAEDSPYQFQIWANDGVQVYVDGKLEIDGWNNKSLNYMEKLIDLTAGSHTVIVKYKEISGVSELRTEIEKYEVNTKRWKASYYPNVHLKGSPVDKTYDNIHFEWQDKSPASGVPRDYFSALYRKDVTVEDGNYLLRVWANDGVQVFVDNELEIDGWNNASLNYMEKPIHLTAGTHHIAIKYKEMTGWAELQFDLEKSQVTTNNWEAIYYPSIHFKGDPVARTYNSIDFNWYGNAPTASIPSDYFSGIFRKEVDVEDGLFNLKVKANDGVQVYIDGKLEIDGWKNKSVNSMEKPVYLSKGKHQVTIFYKEITGWAELSFQMDPLISDSRWYGMAFANDNLTGETARLGLDKPIKELHFDWSWGSPAKNIPTDYFSTFFQREVKVSEGIYKVKVAANDGVQVFVDDKLVVDKWNNQALKSFEEAIYLTEGKHTIKVKYRELIGVAELRLELEDIMQNGSWYGMAFSNANLTGETAFLGEYNQIDFNWGWGSPASNIPGDYFSTLFQGKVTVKEGVYNLQVNSNDGAQVYVNGKLVLDEWDNDQGLKYFEKPIYLTAGTHTIMVKHKELVGVSELKFQLNELMADDRWYGLAFPSRNLTGDPVLLGVDEKIEQLAMDWGAGSPATGIPVDNFSTIFQKYYYTGKGDYRLQVEANDGVQIYIDDQLVLDKWNNKSQGSWDQLISFTEGKHRVVVKNYEATGIANVKVTLQPKKDIRYVYSKYSLTLNKMTDIQMKVNPQTDKRYKLWIREDGIQVDEKDSSKGKIVGGTWNLRRGPGTNYLVGGKVAEGNTVTLHSSMKGTDGYVWYHIRNTSGWVTADYADVKYYINPNNFNHSFENRLQFLKLSQTSNLNPYEVNNKILVNKGILTGMAETFIKAAKKYGVNEIYLISHALLETGNGNSALATGIEVDGVKGKKVVYNMFGIGAKDSCPNTCGAQYAYDAGWFTPEAAIEGGAAFIGKGYVDRGQDTLYKMRWNPEFAAKNNYASHQYASDIGWAYKQTSKMNELFNLLDLYSITFDIPVYK